MDPRDDSAAHLYFEASVAAEMLKKVVLHSVATALASMVFPVPGGPNMSTPCMSMHTRMLNDVIQTQERAGSAPGPVSQAAAMHV